MISSRLINPLHSLTQTARDLAFYLRHINRDEFLQVMTEVRESYGAPAESWLWFVFYSRARRAQLDQIIDELKQTPPVNEEQLPVDNMPDLQKSDTESLSKSDIIKPSDLGEREDAGSLSKSADGALAMSAISKQTPKPKSIIEVVKSMLQEGGWEETSANTNLLRAMLKKLHNYDPGVELTLNEIRVLKDLLFLAIDQRLQAEAKLIEEEARLKAIDEETLRMKKELLSKEQLLLRKKEEIAENESRIQELQNAKSATGRELSDIEQEKAGKKRELQMFLLQLKELEEDKNQREHAYELQLMALAAEKRRREEELESARQTLLLLNPEFDIKKFAPDQLANVMDEAKQVGEVAMKTYLAEWSANERKRAELEGMRGTLAKAKASLSGKPMPGSNHASDEAQTAPGEEDQAARAEREARLKEVKQMCHARNKTNDKAVRSFMEGFFQVKLEEQRQKELHEKQDAKMRESLGVLYSDGIRTKINDAKTLEMIEHGGDVSVADGKKPRRAFKEMKLRGPKSDNPQFQRLAERIGKLLKPRQQPEQEVSSASESAQRDTLTLVPKIDNARRLMLASLLCGASSHSERIEIKHDEQPAALAAPPLVSDSSEKREDLTSRDENASPQVNISGLFAPAKSMNTSVASGLSGEVISDLGASMTLGGLT
ncbi:hypothetical protein AQUSIP_00810 [Aquicella siphonis]|uniref:Uncharacterized protein n=1 Tax=Aquicella siphonis TaxID=254247 RepID=A0A5E4PD45_9COXI|nr:hypothetical protein [Aquicella siphonis]VVC74809.1 hypothetical protein AQUSIP_00810 [Aquicella siphonis]